ncbi:hypothetical protein GOBAR_DD28278 [Gossypium barbadense]|nr:hypothetical protein GOBAR_DD28278 [Gossypium barbadense]
MSIRIEKKKRITIRKRDPELLFLWTPTLDSPRFNAIGYQSLITTIAAAKSLIKRWKKDNYKLTVRRSHETESSRSVSKLVGMEIHGKASID